MNALYHLLHSQTTRDAVMNIHIHYDQSDKIIWSKSDTGSFFFKVDLHRCSSLNSHSYNRFLTPMPKNISKFIWKSHPIFPRISIFLWRLTHNAFPTRARHSKILPNTNVIYPLDDKQDETESY